MLENQEVLYGEQTKLTLENMTFSGHRLSNYPTFIKNAVTVKKACAIANFVAGNLTAEQMTKIRKACDRLSKGEYLDQFPVDVFQGGGGIGVNMNLNEVIATLAGEGVDPVEHVNMSQSTSDVCHTAMRITIDELLVAFLDELDKTGDVLANKAVEFADVDTIARTCFQDGMRISAGAVFEATASAVKRRHNNLSRVGDEMRNVNIGWTVVGSGEGADDAYRQVILEELSKLTGKPFIWNEDLYDAAQYPDDLADVSAEIRIIAEIMSKLSRDLRLLSSGPETGFDEIILPNVQKGSSFFPGKVNPVIPETMIQCAMIVQGNDSVIQSCVGAGEIHINLWEDMMGFLLINNISYMTRALHLLRKRCLEGIKLNEEKCETYANSSIPLVVDFKEKYGYQKLSQAIGEEGLRSVVKRLREERASRKKKGE
ncbi:MAG: aspartate ammonia-lyase [Firmicutes bacterium]|nr:aspartate ammonia-lyase [Bacillota bacterium]